MTRYTLPFALLGLMLLFSACRHGRVEMGARPHFSQEEAEPVSNLPHEEFSRVTPGRSRH